MLRYIVNELKNCAEKNSVQIDYADLPGLRVNGGTIPSNIIPTTEKPDIVLSPRIKPVKSSSNRANGPLRTQYSKGKGAKGGAICPTKQGYSITELSIASHLF